MGEWWGGDGETTMSLKDQGGVSFAFPVRERAMSGFSQSSGNMIYLNFLC